MYCIQAQTNKIHGKIKCHVNNLINLNTSTIQKPKNTYDSLHCNLKSRVKMTNPLIIREHVVSVGSSDYMPIDDQYAKRTRQTSGNANHRSFILSADI